MTKKNSALDGVTNQGGMGIRGRVTLEVVGPDGEVKQRVGPCENKLVSYGLNRLCELIATGGEASNWVSAAAIGTGVVAAATDDATLGNSTQLVHMSQASMAVADGGARSCDFTMTFAATSNVNAVIGEIGLFATNSAAGSMVARSVLTATVSKATADTLNATYQLQFTTA